MRVSREYLVEFLEAVRDEYFIRVFDNEKDSYTVAVDNPKWDGSDDTDKYLVVEIKY